MVGCLAVSGHGIWCGEEGRIEDCGKEALIQVLEGAVMECNMGWI
jgi:hypothetical protein